MTAARPGILVESATAPRYFGLVADRRVSLPSVSRSVVRVVGSLALPLALLAIVWSARLYVRDGVEFDLLGLHVTTNDPVRPLVLSVCLFLLFIATHGTDGAKRVWARVKAIDDRLTVTALSVGVVVLGLLFGTMAATSSDPYGYVSEADLWLRGNLKTTQSWVADVPWPAAGRTFTPLGYHPRSDYGLEDETTIVPTYAPGLPLLMAGAKAVGGEAAVFWVVPLCGGLLILATYKVGCQLASSRVGLTAAWLVATSPIVLYMLMWPMSDVPVAAVSTVMCWLLLRSSVAHAIGAGLACALVILIRPNLVWMSAVPVLLYGVAIWRGNATTPNATQRNATQGSRSYWRFRLSPHWVRLPWQRSTTTCTARLCSPVTAIWEARSARSTSSRTCETMLAG